MPGPPPFPSPQPPPVVAPPPVECLETPSPPAPLVATPSRRPLRRLWRDIRVGSVCMVIGVLIGLSRPPVVLEKVDGELAFSDSDASQGVRTAVTHVPDALTSGQAGDEALLDHVAPVALDLEIGGPMDLDAVVDNVADNRPDGESDPAVTASSETTRRSIIHPDVAVDATSDWIAAVVPPATIETRDDAPQSLTSNSPSIIPPVQCVTESCQEGMEPHGTALMWTDTPADAYRIASQQNRLVFLIHVSGNFEIPGFT